MSDTDTKFQIQLTCRFLAKEALQEADHVLQKVMSEHDSDDRGLDSDQDSTGNVRSREASKAPTSRLAVER